MEQTAPQHNWIIDAKTLFKKCSICGVFQRNYHKRKYGVLNPQFKEVQYSVTGRSNWSKEEIDCKPVIKPKNGKTRKN